MIITKPDYYSKFRCIAAACPDSCCKEWDVQIDEASAAYYRSLSGPLGDRLKEVLQEADGETVMTIIDGRCPMWRQDGLCRIQAELGEAALSHVCAIFPRLRHDYGDRVELGLELSCPEAARLILSAQAVNRLEAVSEEAAEPEYDIEAMDALLTTRETALQLLTSDADPGEALALLLLYGYQAQELLDGGEEEPFSPEMTLGDARALAKEPDRESFLAFFGELEILTPQWHQLLAQPAELQSDTILLPLARYLVERYWLQAVADYDLTCRVKMIVISCILVKLLGGAPETAQLFSKEIENDADNVDALLDAAYTCPAFTDDKLLGFLVK